MPIFSTLASFFRRHKRKIVFTSAASITAYLLVYQLVIKKFRNFQNALKQELYVKEQIKRRYLQTQNDCYLTILALLPVLTQPIMSHLPTEAITTALKRKKNANREMSESLTTENLLAHSEEINHAVSSEMQTLLAKTKIELWDDLKVKSISRVLALIYASSGLLLLTRLQLNILARKSYLESAIAMAGGSASSGSSNSHDYFIEQSYLSLSWWMLNHGWQRIANTLEKHVTRRFSELTPKSELTVDAFHQMLSEISAEAIADGDSPLMHSVFPMEYDHLIETLMSTNPELVSELENKDSNLVKLINETNFILSNEFTSQVFSKLVQSGLATLYENLVVSLNPNHQVNRVNKLATFLAQLSVQSNVLGDAHNYSVDSEIPGNIYINGINDVEELDEFSASIYSNFE